MTSNDSQPDVRDRVRSYYEAQALRPEKMTEILRDIDQASPDALRLDAGRRRFASPAWLAVAAGLLLALVIGGGVFGPGSTDSDSTQDKLTIVVAQEIALNHNKTLKPDYQAVVFADLSRMSDKLGFTPIEPASLAERGLNLQGGRYCSVQGCMAAQLRVVDADGGAYTLYQVRPNERLAQLDPATATVDGVDVELWTEAGLVMGLARTR